MVLGEGAYIAYLTARVLIDPVTTIKIEMKILNCEESVFIRLSIVILIIIYEASRNN